MRPQMFVYFGDNFAVDRAELTQQGVTFIPPPIGAPSHFAQADSFTVHPNWDPNLIHPDMGVVFLDRKPPFDPLPLLPQPRRREPAGDDQRLGQQLGPDADDGRGRAGAAHGADADARVADRRRLSSRGSEPGHARSDGAGEHDQDGRARAELERLLR